MKLKNIIASCLFLAAFIVLGVMLFAMVRTSSRADEINPVASWGGLAGMVRTSAQIQVSSVHGPILSVSGLRTTWHEPEPSPGSYLSVGWTEYFYPQSPEEITVTIRTYDGRKWVARWEEAK